MWVHVPDVRAGLEWYKKVFPNSTVQKVDAIEFVVLDVDGFSIEVVQSDAKVCAGKRGTVLYWTVESLTETVARLQVLGAVMYRGPMEIENNLTMCQLEDPFGNLIGLRGRNT